MGTFTIPLKTVIEITGGTTDIVDGISKLTGGNIGLQYYPIFEEPYRAVLNGKIIDHYWNREIGVETISMFQLAMRRKMNEIMPLYNQIYATTKLNYPALSTIDMRTLSTSGSSQTATTNGLQTTTSNGVNETINGSNSNSRSVTSETPQSMLNGSGDYATGAADVRGESANTTNAEENSTSNAAEDSLSNVDAESNGDTTISGYQGVPAELVMRYRESLLNVDMMVITELEELFMLVWDNGDSYTKGSFITW